MRTVTLVLIDDNANVLGALPPFTVEVPYWPEVGGIVTGVRERFGIDVTVLRLLFAERPAQPGGEVTYLVQARELPEIALVPAEIDLSEQPNRAPYARVGGPADTLDWAGEALTRAARGPLTRAEQQRTWNLSAIWRLTTPDGPVWLKQVPHFFSHEAAVIAWLNTIGGGPELIAAHDGRMLLADIPGDDLYGADLAILQAIAVDMHRYQLASVGDLHRLAAVGVPDRRGSRLTDLLASVVAEHGGGDPRLDKLVAGLDERMAELAVCGLPNTLVHGDLHPGNVRGDAHHRTIIDWGDSFLGHPGFDILRLAEQVTGDESAALSAAWVARWRESVPGSDPERALNLLKPLAALRNAAVYAGFLAAIEPAEHPYHALDVPLWLDQAAQL